jgi:2-octaprenyl-6-methoxyphenol hydroxylase
MTETSAREPIIVLGGGPIGLAAALLLARAGHAVTVVDGRPPAAAQADRRLLALSRGTWQALTPLLAAPPLHAAIERVRVSSAGEFGGTRIDADEIDGAAGAPLGMTVFYGELQRALEAAVAQQPGITPRRPARADAVLQRPQEVSVTLEDGGVLTAAMLIHAEGAPDPGPRAEPAWALLADVQLAGTPPGEAFERFTREGPLALLPAPAAVRPAWSLVWCAGEAAVARRAALSDADFMAELQAAAGATARVHAAHARQVVRLTPCLRERVHEHRAVWLGNAAQTLHPVAGQGFNLGLRDVLTLVTTLAQARRGDALDVPAALATYAERRRADRRVIGTVTRWLPPVFATPLWPVAAARSLGLTALDLLPPLRRQWARLLMFGVRD